MKQVEEYATFAELRKLVVAVKEYTGVAEKEEKMRKKLENKIVLVDDNVLTDQSMLNINSLLNYRPEVCIPEVVVDLLDQRDKRKENVNGQRARNMILELQDHVDKYRFQRVDEYDDPLIEKYQIDRKPGCDRRLIVSAAVYYRSQLKRNKWNGVLILSNAPEVQKLAAKENIEVFESVESLRQKITAES